METTVVVVSVVVALLAAASAVLGFIAQATKLTKDDIQFGDGVCTYSGKPAFVLGICAVPLLVAAQVIATVAGGCFGCVRPRGAGASGARRVKQGIVSSVVSWAVAASAVGIYVRGVKWNAAATREAAFKVLNYEACYYLKDPGFELAAVLTLIAAALGIRSCVLLLTQAPAPAAEGQEQSKPDGQRPAAAGAAPPPPQAHALA